MEAVSLRRIPDNPYNTPAITHLTRTRQTKTQTLNPEAWLLAWSKERPSRLFAWGDLLFQILEAPYPEA